MFGKLKSQLLCATIIGCALPAPGSAEQQEGWTVVLGAGALYKPDYMGSDDFETQPIPFVFVEYGDVFYIHGPMMGYNFIRTGGFKLGALARYQIYAERSSDDNPALRGLEDIEGGVDAGLSLRYEAGLWAGELTVFQDVTDTHDGTIAEFEVDREIPLGDRWHAELAANLSWADGSYTQTYFGITSEQARATDLPVFQAGAGLRSVGMSLGVNYSLTQHCVLRARVEVEQLLSDAADSPLVQDLGSDIQPRVGVFVGYRF